MRKVIIAVVADHGEIATLRAEGFSWAKISERFQCNPAVNLTPSQAEAWHKNGFAIWVGRRRMLITARLEAFARVRDLSAVAGAYVATNRKEEWVGPFLRGQFLRLERS